MADRSLLLDDRVVFHDISYFSDGVGSLPAPGPLAVYPVGLAGTILVSLSAGCGIAGEETLFSYETICSGNDVTAWNAFAVSLPAWHTPVAGKLVEVQGGAYTEISVDELHRC